jgi:hypothetical protein
MLRARPQNSERNRTEAQHGACVASMANRGRRSTCCEHALKTASRVHVYLFGGKDGAHVNRSSGHGGCCIMEGLATCMTGRGLSFSLEKKSIHEISRIFKRIQSTAIAAQRARFDRHLRRHWRASCEVGAQGAVRGGCGIAPMGGGRSRRGVVSAWVFAARYSKKKSECDATNRVLVAAGERDVHATQEIA